MSRKRSKQKHIPLRTCVACRETSPKRELIRLVLIAEGEVVVDETGKLRLANGMAGARTFAASAVAGSAL